MNKKKSPIPGMEYILMYNKKYYDEANGRGVNNPLILPFGTIVKDVVVASTDYKDEIGMYGFTVKETGEKFETFYEWGLAENTPENQKKMKEYCEQNEKLKEQEKVVRELRRQIATLERK